MSELSAEFISVGIQTCFYVGWGRALSLNSFCGCLDVVFSAASDIDTDGGLIIGTKYRYFNWNPLRVSSESKCRSTWRQGSEIIQKFLARVTKTLVCSSLGWIGVLIIKLFSDEPLAVIQNCSPLGNFELL